MRPAGLARIYSKHVSIGAAFFTSLPAVWLPSH
jgi:hypothetical protein